MWAYGRGQTDRQTDRHTERQTERHTDARDHNTFCVVYDSRKNVITNGAANIGADPVPSESRTADVARYVGRWKAGPKAPGSLA